MARQVVSGDMQFGRNLLEALNPAVSPEMAKDSPPDDSDADPDVAGSMSVLIQDWTANEQCIAQRIDGEFFPRLRRFAERVLGKLPGARAEADDVVQSAIKSLCLFMRRQEDGHSKDRDDIWRLLCHIAARKASRRRQRQTFGLHGGSVRPFVDFSEGDDSSSLEELLQSVPPSEFDVLLRDAIEHLDESLQPVAMMTMEGRSQTEISEILGCSRRTVIRKFELIKELLILALSDGP